MHKYYNVESNRKTTDLNRRMKEEEKRTSNYNTMRYNGIEKLFKVEKAAYLY